jgi:ABC-type transport system involved in cytochrome c biogenesis ATPase subunit
MTPCLPSAEHLPRGLRPEPGCSSLLFTTIKIFTAKVGDEEILAIMGRNGMGKTTLLKSLIGILPSKAGSIKLGDQGNFRAGFVVSNACAAAWPMCRRAA